MKQAQLRTVMRIRELQERSVRGELSVARARHRAAVEDEEATWARVDAYGTLLQVEVSPSELQQHRLVAEVGALAAHRLRQVTLDAADVAEEVRVRWVEALDERERAEEAHRAQTEIEDLVLARRAGASAGDIGGVGR
jgi:tRNA G37 N-methylase Trm5